MRALSLAFLAISIALANGFYIPGVAPQEYVEGALVDVKAVKLTSARQPLPFEYYFLPFCKPEKLQRKAENLGEVLRGDRITNTPYELHMNKNVSCTLLCKGADTTGIKYKKSDIVRFHKFIKREFRANWLVDNLPSATRVVLDDQVSYVSGFPIGFVDTTTAKVGLFNHIVLIIKIHEYQPGLFRIVGFEIRTASVDKAAYTPGEGHACQIATEKRPDPVFIDPKSMGNDDTVEVVWSYGVRWEPSPIAWASRWDTYLAMNDAEIHWFSIINSVITVLFLSGITAIIIIRTLSRDIARYNEEDEEDQVEPTGWKLVHGDVMRPPVHPTWLVTLVGTGVQLLSMLIVTLIVACLGMLSPASRGALMTAAIFVFMFMGLIAGYFAGRLYRTLNGQTWKSAAIQLAVFFPAAIFGTGFLLNFFIWGQHSSGAVPFTTMLALLFMWVGISLPLVIGGFYFGYRKGAYDTSLKINQIPRQVPPQQAYLEPPVSVAVAGILPFGAVFIELFFILGAIWENQFYYLFGFLFLVALVLVISCAEITIVLIYLQLCAENYHWWWRSFLLGGSCAIYVFLYSVFYYATKLSIDDAVATLLYFGYSLLMALGVFLATGTIGFYSAFIFIRKIYGSIKID
eukprot:m.230337 g.230337  ORF g.230337 m.230337 type:complete len:629 (-) comp12047_c0_seq1:1325-3211(-)